MDNDYSDIIHLPHPNPVGRQRMSMQARAAQFAPFAALAGHSAAIEETARLTDDEINLYEDKLVLLDRQMQQLIMMLDQCPVVAITYFVPDSLKSGGCYRQTTGIVQKTEDHTRTLTLQDGTRIEIGRIVDIKIGE